MGGGCSSQSVSDSTGIESETDMSGVDPLFRVGQSQIPVGTASTKDLAVHLFFPRGEGYRPRNEYEVSADGFESLVKRRGDFMGGCGDWTSQRERCVIIRFLVVSESKNE